ncbi:hypothetical protein ACEQ8H_000365 [Pleosporales sp. CAS-2024a]
MAELAFCKSFLAALDARPAKLSSDHMADARQYPAQAAYTLPRLPHPPHPARPHPRAPSSSKDASSLLTTVSLKPMKPASPTMQLPGIDAAKTSVYDLKSQYASHVSMPAAKIKLLYQKKPVPDSKTVAQVVGPHVPAEVEFAVMLMGGPVASPVASPPATAPTETEKGLAPEPASVAVGPSGNEVVATDQFWSDLKAFLRQRTKDDMAAERLTDVFRAAWETSK